jgi:hypothetical protein
MKWAGSGEGTRSEFTTVHPSSMSAATTARPSLLPPVTATSIHLRLLRFAAAAGVISHVDGAGQKPAG